MNVSDRSAECPAVDGSCTFALGVPSRDRVLDLGPREARRDTLAQTRGDVQDTCRPYVQAERSLPKRDVSDPVASGPFRSLAMQARVTALSSKRGL